LYRHADMWQMTCQLGVYRPPSCRACVCPSALSSTLQPHSRSAQLTERERSEVSVRGEGGAPSYPIFLTRESVHNTALPNATCVHNGSRLLRRPGYYFLLSNARSRSFSVSAAGSLTAFVRGKAACGFQVVWRSRSWHCNKNTTIQVGCVQNTAQPNGCCAHRWRIDVQLGVRGVEVGPQ
jgi:hypothetical protein